jgi:hypothetical protein
VKYPCLAYEEERVLDALSRAEWDVSRKETLGGFFPIEARDLNEAIQGVSQWPSARLGSIEVRPIHESLRRESRYGGTA